MASRAFDGFSRDNGPIGNAETGQPWAAHRGNASVKDARAFFPAENPGAIYTVDTGLGGWNATVSMDFIPGDGGGQALYFRVVDVNRWWRLFKQFNSFGSSYQYQSGTTPETFGWVGNGTYYYEPAGEFQFRGTADDTSGRALGAHYEAFDSRINAYTSYSYIYMSGGRRLVDHYRPRSVYENQSYVKTGGGEPIYSTGYTTSQSAEVRLEKCVNGQTTLVKAATVDTNISSIGVKLTNDEIVAYGNGGMGEWGPINDPTHAKATRHGIGYSEMTHIGNTQGIDSFVAFPAITTAYMPPLML